MTSSGWTRQHRCEYRQTTVQEPWGATDWFYLQFLMIAVGVLGKELIRWNKGGR